MKHLVIVILFSVVATSCKKPEDRACWKSTGNQTSISIELPSFEKLELNEHVEYHLVEDSVHKVVLSGGENLLNLIDLQVADNKLTVKNKNKCKFLRSYKKKKIRAEIHFVNLFNIDFRGSESLTNQDTLHTDWFTLSIKDGAGPVTLTLNSQGLFAGVSHGYGNFNLFGKTNFASFDVASNGYCDVRGLEIRDSIRFKSRTSVDCKINSYNIPLRAETRSYGNIYYTGIPTVMEFKKEGEGDLIKLD